MIDLAAMTTAWKSLIGTAGALILVEMVLGMTRVAGGGTGESYQLFLFEKDLHTNSILCMSNDLPL